MQYKIIDERPWQILSNAMTIGPSSTGYQLQVAADGRNYTTLFTVGAGITRQITNLSSGSYFRMKGNVGEVTVNWVRDCSGGGGGEGGNAGELEPVSEFPVGVPAGTVVALASGDTVGVYQYDGTDWAPIGGGDMSNYYTKAETDAAITSATQDFVTEADITAATAPIQEQVDDIERVTATALTELHDAIIELSGATGDYATEAYVDAAITSATQDFVTADDLSGYTSEQDFQDFQDAISVKEEVIASAITELHTDVLALSAATPDMSDYYTSAQTEDAISAATAGKADAANVTPNDFMRFPKWNEQGVITGTTGNNLSTTGFYLNGIRRNLIKEATSGDLGDAYAPITPGTAGQILVSSGNGAPVWATDNKVDSQDVKHIVKLTQAEYDALTVKDPNTFYIIVSQ